MSLLDVYTLQITSTINSTGPTIGSISTLGGLGVVKDTFLGGNLNVGGITTITNTTTSTSTSTGAAVITGGLGVGGSIYGGNIYSNGILLSAYTQGTNISISSNVISTISNPTFSGLITGNLGLTVTSANTSVTTLSASGIINANLGLTVIGGNTSTTTLSTSALATLNSVSVSGTSTLAVTTISGNTSITSTTTSTTTSSGALTIVGGVGIGGNLNIGGTTGLVVLNTSGLINANLGLIVTGANTSVTTLSTSSLATLNSLVVSGTSTFNGNTSISNTNTFTIGTGLFTTGGLVSITNTTASSVSSGSVGSIVTAGGICIGKNITIGTNSLTSFSLCDIYQPVRLLSDSCYINSIVNRGMMLSMGVNGTFVVNGNQTTSIMSIAIMAVASTTNRTLTDTSTLSIDGAPVGDPGSGGTVTMVNPWSIRVVTGNSFFGGTTASTSNNTGAIVTTGGICSSNTTNSTSATNGGTFTTAGGAAIAKDMYVGGNLNVLGIFTSPVIVPGSRTKASLVNTSSVAVNNQILSVNGTNNNYSATFSCIPTTANTLTSFVTDLPNRTSNSTFVYEIISTIQGFDGLVNISNCVCFAVTGTTNFQIQFTSIDNTNAHYIQIRANYISN